MQFPPRENVNNAPLVIGVIVALCALSSAVVLLRVWVRTIMTKQGLGMDDWFMIAAMVVNFAESSIICASTKFGLGRHIEFAANPTMFFKLAYGLVLVYITLIFLIKQSLILFYWRLSRSKYFHAWCWVYLGLNTAIWITFSLACAFACRPVPYFWDRTIPGGKCLNLENLYLINAGFFVFMDVAALLLPIPAVWRLNMKLKKKLQLLSLFIIGFFVCIASFIRMTTMFNFNSEPDATWAMVKSNIWSMIEINIGIITVCTPVIKHYFTRLLWPKITGKSYESSSSGQSYPHQGSNASKPHDHSNRIGLYNASANAGKGISSIHGKGITVTTQHFIEHEMGPYGSRKSPSTSDDDANSASTSTKELRMVESQTGPIRGHDIC